MLGDSSFGEKMMIVGGLALGVILALMAILVG
jgi:hypothetical protein